MKKNTEDFMSLWNCPKPTIAKVHGFAAAGKVCMRSIIKSFNHIYMQIYIDYKLLRIINIIVFNK